MVFLANDFPRLSLDPTIHFINTTKRIAVLGIKTDAQADQPSVYVPQYMQRAGFEIVPVPVYYPDATMILGEKVYRKLTDIPGDIDMVDVFRRPNDITGHIDDSKCPKETSDYLRMHQQETVWTLSPLPGCGR